MHPCNSHYIFIKPVLLCRLKWFDSIYKCTFLTVAAITVSENIKLQSLTQYYLFTIIHILLYIILYIFQENTGLNRE